MQEIDYTIPHDREEFRIVKSVYACGKVERNNKKYPVNIYIAQKLIMNTKIGVFWMRRIGKSIMLLPKVKEK